MKKDARVSGLEKMEEFCEQDNIWYKEIITPGDIFENSNVNEKIQERKEDADNRGSEEKT